MSRVCLTCLIDAISASATRAGLLSLLALLVVGLSVVALPGLLSEDDSEDESDEAAEQSSPTPAPDSDAPTQAAADGTGSAIPGDSDQLTATARISSDGIVLDGLVATEGQRDALVDAARRRVGPAMVTDDLRVATGLATSEGRDNGVVALQSFITAVPGGVTVAATASAKTLDVVGEAQSAESMTALERALGTAAASSPDTSTTNTVSVPPPPPPTPEEIEAAAQAELEALNSELAGTVLFATSSNEPTEEFRQLLDRLPSILESNPEVVVEIVGHTDDRGSSEGNQKLSDQRATAAVDYLLAKGVNSARLTARGAGEAEPIATNSTRDGRAANRRVVLNAYVP